VALVTLVPVIENTMDFFEILGDQNTD